MIPIGFNSDACAARRERLAERFSGAAWVVSGRPSPRQYPGNPFPFRAASHFLYFVGAPFEGASLVLDGGEWTLYVQPKPSDDALWHGPSDSMAELAQRLGLPVKSAESLELPAGVATLAAVDEPTRREQEARLGRRLGSASDLELADAVIALRLRHDDAAQAELRRAADATVAAHRAGMAATRPGVSESAVRGAMEKAIIAHGMTCGYQPIVTVHGEVLHNPYQVNDCDSGDLLLADVGAETRGGWNGDVTRTWPVSGKLSGTQLDIYQVVLASHDAAVAKVAPGVRYKDVHVEACRVFAAGLCDLGVFKGDPDELVADGVHALLFPHGVGHLLGLDTHDMEDLGDRAGYASGRTRSDQFGLSYLRLDRDLEASMVVTIEPGFYQVPAILADPERRKMAGDRIDWAKLELYSDVRGIRIEDDVLVTPSGRLLLTAALPRTPGEVCELVGAA